MHHSFPQMSWWCLQPQMVIVYVIVFYKEIVTLVGHIGAARSVLSTSSPPTTIYRFSPALRSHWYIYISPINKSTSKLQRSPKNFQSLDSFSRNTFKCSWIGTRFFKVFSKFPAPHEIFHPFIPGCSRRCSRSCCAKNPLAAGRLALVNSCLRRKMMWNMPLLLEIREIAAVEIPYLFPSHHFQFINWCVDKYN